MDNTPDALPLEQRVARLEGRLGWRRIEYVLAVREASISLMILLAGVATAVVGLGVPNHWYQIVLAVLLVALCYHREWIIAPASRMLTTVLASVNVVLIAMVLKLVIGSGKRFPFFWALFPTVSSVEQKDPEKWVNVMPQLALQWQQSELALWSIDLTIVQTFLLMVTMFGALFEFQPFVSFTAFLLIVVSIPALVAFNWTWVFPTMVLLAIGLYLQSASYQEDF